MTEKVENLAAVATLQAEEAYEIRLAQDGLMQACVHWYDRVPCPKWMEDGQ